MGGLGGWGVGEWSGVGGCCMPRSKTDPGLEKSEWLELHSFIHTFSPPLTRHFGGLSTNEVLCWAAGVTGGKTQVPVLEIDIVLSIEPGNTVRPGRNPRLTNPTPAPDLRGLFSCEREAASSWTLDKSHVGLSSNPGSVTYQSDLFSHTSLVGADISTCPRRSR
jgi:hypothetical protein